MGNSPITLPRPWAGYHLAMFNTRLRPCNLRQAKATGRRPSIDRISHKGNIPLRPIDSIPRIKDRQATRRGGARVTEDCINKIVGAVSCVLGLSAPGVLVHRFLLSFLDTLSIVVGHVWRGSSI